MRSALLVALPLALLGGVPAARAQDPLWGWQPEPQAALTITTEVPEPEGSGGMVAYVSRGLAYYIQTQVNDTDTWYGPKATSVAPDSGWTFGFSYETDDAPSGSVTQTQLFACLCSTNVYVPLDAEPGWDAQLVVFADNAPTTMAADQRVLVSRTIVATSE